MADFKLAFKRTMEHEGGYSTHPLDKGGQTLYGIASKYHPNVFKLMLHLYQSGKKEGAKRIAEHVYKINYWNPFRLDNLEPQYLAEQIFDISVNFGILGCKRLLNRATMLLNTNLLPIPNMAKTLEYIKEFNPKEFNNMLVNVRKSKYNTIVAKDTSQAVFIKGWTKRAESFIV